jgi:hypothetical protein
MDDCTRVMRRPRWAWPLAARTVAAVIATAVLALLAAACSSGSPSSASSGGSPDAEGSSSSPSAVAYSACMRSHGVPKFPDPGSGGAIPKGDAQYFGVSSSQLQAAQSACQPLLPTVGSIDQQTEQCMSSGNCPPALVQQILNLERQFAQCMRSHGLPHWPDPTLESQGRPIFIISISKDLGGVDPHEPQISTKEDECGRLTGSPEPRQVNP